MAKKLGIVTIYAGRAISHNHQTVNLLNPQHQRNISDSTHMMSKRDSLQTPDTIYSAAQFRPQAPPAAAYAVYFKNHSHQIRLSQPLATTHQAYRTAALHGLLSSLQVVTCLHLQDVHLFLDDRHLVDLFLTRPTPPNLSSHPQKNASSQATFIRRSTAPIHLHSALDLKLWRSVLTLADNHVANGGSLSVTHAPDVGPMPMVRKLAENALLLHQLCPRCNRNYGPVGTPHTCGSSPTVIDQLTDSMGNTCVASAVCPNCTRRFDHLAALEKHIESDCPEVLQKWFSHTKIVKL